MFDFTKLGFSAFQQTAIKCAYNASRGMIDLLTEAGLEPALLLLLTERLPINGPGHIYLKPTSCLIAISSIGSWMMSFCPYITFTIVSLCQWNTIASYGKCLLVIRRCLKLYPVSMPVRCDIDLTVIFKSCRALYCLSIPIPLLFRTDWPVRPTWH